MQLPKELLEKKLESVCFICRARLRPGEQGKTWKLVAYRTEGNMKPVPVCLKHIKEAT